MQNQYLVRENAEREKTLRKAGIKKCVSILRWPRPLAENSEGE